MIFETNPFSYSVVSRSLMWEISLGEWDFKDINIIS